MIDKEKLIEEIREEINILNNKINMTYDLNLKYNSILAKSNLYIALSNLYK